MHTVALSPKQIIRYKYVHGIVIKYSKKKINVCTVMKKNITKT